jgi:hypothetical protein
MQMEHDGFFKLKETLDLGGETILKDANVHAIYRGSFKCWLIDHAHVQGVPLGSVPIYDFDVIPMNLLERR